MAKLRERSEGCVHRHRSERAVPRRAKAELAFVSAAVVLVVSIFLPPQSAFAIVGGAPPATDAAAHAVVTLIGSRGTFCSGALIARDIVLTAAHCVRPGAEYKLIEYDAAQQPQVREVKRILWHPDYTNGAIANHRASADVALVQLAAPLAAQPIAIGAPIKPAEAGRTYRVIGIGVTISGDGRSGGIARSASLVATGRPGTLQIRLVDPATQNAHSGLGACTGDSGAPVVEDQNGRTVLVGVVSWSTAAENTDGCGGLTGATPLARYREWIMKTVIEWGRS